MVLFFFITLAISITGLILILVLKRIEVRTGRMLLRGARPGAGRFFGGALIFGEHVIPGAARGAVRGLLHLGKQGIQFVRVKIALVFEKKLEVLLHRVRKASRSEPRGEASGFLREVADHKRSLQAEPEKKRAIFDDQ